MEANEDCKICLSSEADNIPILNIITIGQLENLTGIRPGPLKVKKIYICKKCALAIKQTREIQNTILNRLVARRKRPKAECRNVCLLNNEHVADTTRDIQSVEIADLLRRKLEIEEQGKEFACKYCFKKIKTANKTLKKMTVSLNGFLAKKTAKQPKLKKHKNETKNDDMPTTSTGRNSPDSIFVTAMSPLEWNERVDKRNRYFSQFY